MADLDVERVGLDGPVEQGQGRGVLTPGQGDPGPRERAGAEAGARASPVEVAGRAVVVAAIEGGEAGAEVAGRVVGLAGEVRDVLGGGLVSPPGLAEGVGQAEAGRVERRIAPEGGAEVADRGRGIGGESRVDLDAQEVGRGIVGGVPRQRSRARAAAGKS